MEIIQRERPMVHIKLHSNQITTKSSRREGPAYIVDVASLSRRKRRITEHLRGRPEHEHPQMHRVWFLHEQRQEVQRRLQDEQVPPDCPYPPQFNATKGRTLMRRLPLTCPHYTIVHEKRD